MLPPELMTLICLLSDGEYHSGESLGESLGVTRAAVWKKIKMLDALGLYPESVRGKGYRIPGGVDLLNKERIQKYLCPQAQRALGELMVHYDVGSTNSALIQKVDGEECGPGIHVCLAEHQSQGRGRLGRQWQSPFAANIYLSARCRFDAGVNALEGLSLAVGVAVVRVLVALGVHQARLKWPNDILVGRQKLGGILIEVAGDLAGGYTVVVGVGLNVSMPERASSAIDQPWCDLSGFIPVGSFDRSLLAASILNELLPLLTNYEQDGFKRYKEEWELLNAYRDERVALITPSNRVEGIMKGVSETGALRMALDDGHEQVFVGGEISLRSVEAKP